MLPAWVPNRSALFGLSCPYMELHVECMYNKFGVCL